MFRTKDNVKTTLRTFVDEDDLFVISMEETEFIDGKEAEYRDVMQISINDCYTSALAAAIDSIINMVGDAEIAIDTPDGNEIVFGKVDTINRTYDYYLSLIEKEGHDGEEYPYMTAIFKQVPLKVSTPDSSKESVAFHQSAMRQFKYELEAYSKLIVETRIQRDLDMNTRENLAMDLNLEDFRMSDIKDSDVADMHFNGFPKVQDLMK